MHFTEISLIFDTKKISKLVIKPNIFVYFRFCSLQHFCWFWPISLHTSHSTGGVLCCACCSSLLWSASRGTGCYCTRKLWPKNKLSSSNVCLKIAGSRKSPSQCGSRPFLPFKHKPHAKSTTKPCSLILCGKSPQRRPSARQSSGSYSNRPNSLVRAWVCVCARCSVNCRHICGPWHFFSCFAWFHFCWSSHSGTQSVCLCSGASNRQEIIPWRTVRQKFSRWSWSWRK